LQVLEYLHLYYTKEEVKKQKGDKNGKRKAFSGKNAWLGSYRWSNSWNNLYNFPLEINPIIKPTNKTKT